MSVFGMQNLEGNTLDMVKKIELLDVSKRSETNVPCIFLVANIQIFINQSNIMLIALFANG